MQQLHQSIYQWLAQRSAPKPVMKKYTLTSTYSFSISGALIFAHRGNCNSNILFTSVRILGFNDFANLKILSFVFTEFKGFPTERRSCWEAGVWGKGTPRLLVGSALCASLPPTRPCLVSAY